VEGANVFRLRKEGCFMLVRDYIEYQDKKIAVDDEGYLVNYDDWNETVAKTLAERAGVGELSQDRIAILKFIREYYKQYNFSPLLRAVCKNVHRPKDCVHEEFYNPLLAWKLAGLPKPEEPIISLLEAGQSPG
jgi:TusE/DsrC/DsvC family sulfur relay protein